MKTPLLTLCLCLAGSGTALGAAAPPSEQNPPVARPESTRSTSQVTDAFADACYQQAMQAWAGARADCDALISQAQSRAVERALLASAYSNRGLIVGQRALLTNDPESLTQALEDAQTAAELAPTRVEPLLNQASLLLTLNRVPDALELYDRVLSTLGPDDPFRAVALFNRAIAQRALGDMAAAAADLRAAREVMARNQRDPEPTGIRPG